MKYLAWDVGIKNLAYCLLESDPKSDIFLFKILEWGLIDFSKDLVAKPVDEDALPCNERLTIQKAGEEIRYCSRKSVYLYKNDNSSGLCKTHYKKLTPAKKDKLYKKGTIIYCQKLIFSQKDNNTKYCTKKACKVSAQDSTIGYCSAHTNLIPKDKVYNDIDQKTKKTVAVHHLGVHNLASSLVDELDKYPTILEADYVLIENQPVYKNPTMKSIQMVLYTYLLMRGKEGKAKFKEYKFYQAGKKVDVFPDLKKKFVKDVAHLKNKYSATKKLSCLITEASVGETPVGETSSDQKWSDFFKGHPKKDDLADAYLMGCHFVKKQFDEQQKLKAYRAKGVKKEAKKEPPKDAPPVPPVIPFKIKILKNKKLI